MGPHWPAPTRDYTSRSWSCRNRPSPEFTIAASLPAGWKENELYRSLDSRKPVSLLMIDRDSLQRITDINDAHGITVGRRSVQRGPGRWVRAPAERAQDRHRPPEYGAARVCVVLARVGKPEGVGCGGKKIAEFVAGPRWPATEGQRTTSGEHLVEWRPSAWTPREVAGPLIEKAGRACTKAPNASARAGVVQRSRYIGPRPDVACGPIDAGSAAPGMRCAPRQEGTAGLPGERGCVGRASGRKAECFWPDLLSVQRLAHAVAGEFLERTGPGKYMLDDGIRPSLWQRATCNITVAAVVPQRTGDGARRVLDDTRGRWASLAHLKSGQVWSGHNRLPGQ